MQMYQKHRKTKSHKSKMVSGNTYAETVQIHKSNEVFKFTMFTFFVAVISCTTNCKAFVQFGANQSSHTIAIVYQFVKHI